MSQQATILIGGNGERQLLLQPRFANRHGLVAGATGTGKTVTLQVLAEQFSRLGVPVFMADVKGDLAGISQPGNPHPKVDERLAHIGIGDFAFAASPVVFWDLYSEKGHPIRATISDMGPLLLARLLDLNETQEGILNLVFQVADDEGLLLLDMADLRSLLNYVGDNAASFKTRYGNVSAASIGAIQRSLLVLEREGGEHFFGEPMLDFWDLLRTAPDGRGFVNILAADKLIHSPRLYATFLLWLLSELFENLPEVGDADKPRFVFFFDEAHLLFNDAPKALLNKIEQVVRLIRSKGVGVYFITQSPLDVPESVLGQLGNRVQHALRAFTPKDQKAVRAAATTFRQNPALDTETAITQMGVGEALVSVLENKGIPGMVERVLVSPPRSRIGPVSEQERADIVRSSPFAGRYERALDRESAHEMLTQRGLEVVRQQQEQQRQVQDEKKQSRSSGRASNRQSVGEAFAKSVTRTIGSSIGRQIVRGILGSLFKGK
ncbi:MAG: ATP-binding protein [Gammaproteobacteria bacterium BRH_c0]|nr:MAG: ATP-binding protein [Gammaproteobacteria bacterium BRH_c0]